MKTLRITKKGLFIMSESLFLSPEEAADIRELVEQNKAAAEARKKEDSWTKEKIMAVKDQRKRQALIKEHMDLFRG